VQYDSLVRVGPSTARVRISTKKYSDNIDKTFFGEEEIGILDMKFLTIKIGDLMRIRLNLFLLEHFHL
jgi:hypothetical protein